MLHIPERSQAASKNEPFATAALDTDDLLNAVLQRARNTAIGYGLICGVYIVLSGLALFYAYDDEQTLLSVEISKGLAFVIITSVILYVILRRSLVKLLDMTVAFRQVFDAVTDVVLVIDRRTRTITDCNPAVVETSGYEPSELIGQSTQALHVSAEHFREFDELVAEILSKSNRFVGEFRMRRRNGEAFQSQHSIGVYRDAFGIPMAISVVRDISHQKKIEEELRHTQRLKSIGQLASGLAHDFNNHLTVIMTNLSLAEGNSATTATVKNQVENALRAARRAAQLASNLTASARQQTSTPVLVDLRLAPQKAFQFLERVMGSKITLFLDIPESPINVMADPGQLEDAILNLAINSRDAMPRGGKLTLAVSKHSFSGRKRCVGGHISPGAYGILRVSDTGDGVSPEMLDQITKPFFTTKEVGKGTGLGLNMVAEFMRNSKGYLCIDSELEKGTSVDLYFPLA